MGYFVSGWPSAGVFDNAGCGFFCYRGQNFPHLAKTIVKKQQTPTAILNLIREVLRMVQAPALASRVCRDPDDDAALACAKAAHADLIVSGDQDLLVLQAFEGIQIVTVAQALERLRV